MSIVRGIDYYTGIVFEVVDRDHPDLGSLCGGGRYDVLPKLFGRPDLPATGAAGGVERIALSMGKPRALCLRRVHGACAGGEGPRDCLVAPRRRDTHRARH